MRKFIRNFEKIHPDFSENPHGLLKNPPGLLRKSTRTSDKIHLNFENIHPDFLENSHGILKKPPELFRKSTWIFEKFTRTFEKNPYIEFWQNPPGLLTKSTLKKSWHELINIFRPIVHVNTTKNRIPPGILKKTPDYFKTIIHPHFDKKNTRTFS